MEQQIVETKTEQTQESIEVILKETEQLSLGDQQGNDQQQTAEKPSSGNQESEEQKESDENPQEDDNKSDKENILEEQRKKIDRFQQCILAIIALKKMNTDHMPAKIIENLYLGSIGAALKKDVIVQLNIKFILSAMDKSKPMFQDICVYKQVPILDSPEVDIQKYFDESGEFINQAIENKQNILVHCFAGKSRSTTLVLAYLMKYQGLNLNESLNLVKQTREIAQPNSGFMNQLKQYEEKLRVSATKQVEQTEI